MAKRTQVQPRLTGAEVDAQIRVARARPARAYRAGRLALGAHYDAKHGRVVMELSNGCLFGFPVSMIPELAGATPLELAEVEASPGGFGLRWEVLDIDLSVSELLIASVPRAERGRELARLAGQATSDAKAASSRENGKKGGRPRLKAESRGNR